MHQDNIVRQEASMKDFLCLLGLMKSRQVINQWLVQPAIYTEYVWFWQEFEAHDYEKPMTREMRNSLLPDYLR